MAQDDGQRMRALPRALLILSAAMVALIVANGMWPGPAGAEPTTRLRVATEIANESLDEQFGWFNLLVIFFVTLGPLKVIPVFAKMTQGADANLRRQLALRSTAISTVVVVLVVFLGQNILQVWTIQLPALLIAGGLLLGLVSLQIILTQYGPPAQTAPLPDTAPTLAMAVTPLAFPTILPPFGIAIALTLMVLSRQLGLSPAGVVGALVVVMGLNLVTMLAARPILRYLRPVTLRILGFTLGVMQLALGIQLILLGVDIQVLALQQMMQLSP